MPNEGDIGQDAEGRRYIFSGGDWRPYSPVVIERPQETPTLTAHSAERYGEEQEPEQEAPSIRLKKYKDSDYRRVSFWIDGPSWRHLQTLAQKQGYSSFAGRLRATYSNFPERTKPKKTPSGAKMQGKK